MKFLITILVFAFSITTSSNETNTCKNTLQTHIKEAVAHNGKFYDIYSAQTDGESTFLSISLMTMERLSLFLLKGLDNKAQVFQEAGIPVMCEEIVSMKFAPSLKEKLPDEKRPKYFTEIDMDLVSKEIKMLLAEEKFDEVYQYLTPIILELEKNPEQGCLTRHFFESMARTIKLIPIHKKRAEELGLEDPTPLAKKFLNLQHFPLKFNYHLDKRAFKLQKEGTPIFCNDVPPIPWK